MMVRRPCDGGHLIGIVTRLGKRGWTAKYLTQRPEQSVHPKGPATGAHRATSSHVQRFVVNEAVAKSYALALEYELPGGGIVDVHLGCGRDTVAVEIPITSTARGELDHLSACLDAGYARVIALILSDAVRSTLERDLAGSFSVDERERIMIASITQNGNLL